MVNQILLHPQEIEVFYILPTIRKYLSQAMKKKGLTQKRIAVLLCIRESTVSQYLNEKRATQVTFSPKIQQKVAEAAGHITNRASLVYETQRLLELVRKENVLCQLHKKLTNLPETCTLNKMGCK